MELEEIEKLVDKYIDERNFRQLSLLLEVRKKYFQENQLADGRKRNLIKKDKERIERIKKMMSDMTSEMIGVYKGKIAIKSYEHVDFKSTFDMKK
jgi:predicted glycosyl hydrolase (DUF1957 family)